MTSGSSRSTVKSSNQFFCWDGKKLRIFLGLQLLYFKVVSNKCIGKPESLKKISKKKTQLQNQSPN